MNWELRQCHCFCLLIQIIPQAICSRYGLAVGANFVWLVRVLMIICYPISYPIGKVIFVSLGSLLALGVSSIPLFLFDLAATYFGQYSDGTIYGHSGQSWKYCIGNVILLFWVSRVCLFCTSEQMIFLSFTTEFY